MCSIADRCLCLGSRARFATPGDEPPSQGFRVTSARCVDGSLIGSNGGRPPLLPVTAIDLSHAGRSRRDWYCDSEPRNHRHAPKHGPAHDHQMCRGSLTQRLEVISFD